MALSTRQKGTLRITFGSWRDGLTAEDAAATRDRACSLEVDRGYAGTIPSMGIKLGVVSHRAVGNQKLASPAVRAKLINGTLPIYCRLLFKGPISHRYRIRHVRLPPNENPQEALQIPPRVIRCHRFCHPHANSTWICGADLVHLRHKPRAGHRRNRLSRAFQPPRRRTQKTYHRPITNRTRKSREFCSPICKNNRAKRKFVASRKGDKKLPPFLNTILGDVATLFVIRDIVYGGRWMQI